MRPIKSARYTNYQGHQIRVNEGETTPQAISRYKKQLAQEEADRLESEKLAKEEKERARAERRRTPKYSDGTIVLTKDGEYFQVYDGYYSEYDDDIEYDAVPCTETGKWITPRNDWEDLTINLYQKEIQKKVKEEKSSKVTASSRTFTKYPSSYVKAAKDYAIDLYSSEKLHYADQMAYKRAFEKEFGEAPFYFDNIYLVDKNTNETIRGAYLNASSYRHFTEILVKHFNLA